MLTHRYNWRASAHVIAACVLGSVLVSHPQRASAQTSGTRAPAPARPSLRVTPLTGTLRLDGKLDDEAWLAADSIADLTQIEPVEGARPLAGRTVVRVLADADNIIFGIRADDSHGLVNVARERDASLNNEDHIKIVLDTYLDGRSGLGRRAGSALNDQETRNAECTVTGIRRDSRRLSS